MDRDQYYGLVAIQKIVDKLSHSLHVESFSYDLVYRLSSSRYYKIFYFDGVCARSVTVALETSLVETPYAYA